MVTSYQTLAGPAEGEYKDKGSKFIGYAYPVVDEGQVKPLLAALHKLHPKNRHVCYAFSIGIEEPLERSNDDGEPSGSAGKPILGQIHSQGLNNVLVAVVRYFGGTLLGVPGLIHAYKTAAHEALSAAQVVTRTISAVYELQAPYAEVYGLLNYLKRTGVVIMGQELGEPCVITVSIDVESEQNFRAGLASYHQTLVTFKRYA